MNLRKSLLAVSLVAALPAAFATSGATFVGGEIGFETHPLKSTVTREQVRAELEAFRAHPVAADGTVFVNGEAGFVPAGQAQFADREPATPHTHVLGNTAAPRSAAAPLTDTQRRDYEQQYIN
jgi:hypothetical protein